MKWLLLLFVFTRSFSQDINSKPVTYLSLSPCVTNNYGSFDSKLSPTIEYGITFNDGLFTAGLSIGRVKNDRVLKYDNYLEIRTNLNVFQVGKFCNTIGTGIGIANPNNLMIETVMGIEYSYTDTLHFNIFTGNYYYSGKSIATSQNNVNFTGISIVKFFKPTTIKSVLK